MEHAAAQQLARALGHVEIAAHVRVPIADLADLSRLHFPPVVVKNENLERLGIRLAHRGGRLGTRKRVDGNQAARLRRSVAVVDLRALDAQAVGGLARQDAHPPRELEGVMAAQKRRRQIPRAHARFAQIAVKALVTFPIRIRHQRQRAPVGARIGVCDGRGNEIHRAHAQKRVGAAMDSHAVNARRLPGVFERAVLVQNALGAAGRTGGVGDVAKAMQIDGLEALDRLRFENFRPCGLVDVPLAVAVAANERGALRVVLDLGEHEGRAGAQGARNAGEQPRTARQAVHDDVLGTDAGRLQPRAHAARQFPMLSIGNPRLRIAY